MTVKFTMEITEEAKDILLCAAHYRGISPGEFVRRAIASYIYQKLETDKGRSIAITDNEGAFIKFVELP